MQKYCLSTKLFHTSPLKTTILFQKKHKFTCILSHTRKHDFSPGTVMYGLLQSLKTPGTYLCHPSAPVPLESGGKDTAAFAVKGLFPPRLITVFSEKIFYTEFWFDNWVKKAYLEPNHVNVSINELTQPFECLQPTPQAWLAPSGAASTRGGSRAPRGLKSHVKQQVLAPDQKGHGNQGSWAIKALL